MYGVLAQRLVGQQQHPVLLVDGHFRGQTTIYLLCVIVGALFVSIYRGLSYFDNVRHHILLEKVARRVSDGEVLHLLGLTLKAYGWASLRAE